MLKEKYQSVLELGEKLNIQNGDVSEQDGMLNIKGTAGSPYEKNLLWDAIKSVGGNNPTDIKANIQVADTSVFHRHTVKKGETLGVIAKQYYGNAMNYKQIFQANTSILKNPDTIYPDQELVIPNL
jgi:nucleoid-associated protein YgaU|tara:strand:+ start:181 stop:558 length:378 start_codon:yes stop_codon:yes gene_type:complete